VLSPIVGYAGMSHLGLNSAVAAADKGFQLVCYDSDPRLIKALTRGELPVIEPDLPELLEKNADRIKFTSDANALTNCDLVYIAQDVPTDATGSSDLELIDVLIRRVRAVLSPNAVLVILSQVPPGFTRARIWPGLLLHYQVETLIFGRAMERARFPERFIIGCANPELPLPVALSSFLTSFSCPVLPMRYESAELAKISINMCLVASVGVANTMAEVCEKTGADWAEIVPALKLDKRIGAYSYLNPGLGIAGGNLERDLFTVLSLSKLHGTDAGIVVAWVENSAHRKDWAWSVLKNFVLNEQPHAKIAVLGLAYKEDTHSTKNSPSLALLARLNNYSVHVYDPVVAVETTGLDLMAASSAIDAIQDADVVCIMTPWAEFKKMSVTDLANRMRGRWVLDPYRVLDGKAVEAVGLSYVTLGVAPREVL
jgi:UDPglucose 6-dehydrogenase